MPYPQFLGKHQSTALFSPLDFIQYKQFLKKMTGIGSPNVAVIMEELIALGGKVFLNVGTAGGLHHEGVFLCAKALRDEGTSHHYLKPGKFAFPDKGLMRQLGESIEKQELEFNW